MASKVQKRRGSPCDHAVFTSGAAGEVTVELPTTRGSGATQAFGALYVHHGDGAVGDRIPAETEIKNTVRTVVDEQKFLAKIKGFRPIDDDFDTANPDILPSRWEYEWEEVSISGGNTDVFQVVTITFSNNASADETIAVTVPEDLYGSTEVVSVSITNGMTATQVAAAIATAVTNNSDSVYDAANNSSATVTFTGTIKGGLRHPSVSAIAGVTVGSVDVTTPGRKYNLVTGSTGDLGRKSDPGNDNTHEFAAINIAEIANSRKFIGPGIGDGIGNIVSQAEATSTDVINVFPTNYKVVPIGGSTDYLNGEPNTQAADTADHFRNTAVEYVVEMTERRKLNPGTGSGQTVGTANSDGFNVFYYFNVPNAIIGPC